MCELGVCFLDIGVMYWIVMLVVLCVGVDLFDIVVVEMIVLMV